MCVTKTNSWAVCVLKLRVAAVGLLTTRRGQGTIIRPAEDTEREGTLRRDLQDDTSLFQVKCWNLTKQEEWPSWKVQQKCSQTFDCGFYLKGKTHLFKCSLQYYFIQWKFPRYSQYFYIMLQYVMHSLSDQQYPWQYTWPLPDQLFNILKVIHIILYDEYITEHLPVTCHYSRTDIFRKYLWQDKY